MKAESRKDVFEMPVANVTLFESADVITESKPEIPDPEI